LEQFTVSMVVVKSRSVKIVVFICNGLFQVDYGGLFLHFLSYLF